MMRTCRDLGIKTVAIYSEPDANSLHVKMADEAVCVGPAASSESYLNIPAILEACRTTGAQAVHPGYGFLSENFAFCKELEQAGVVFIGPKTDAIVSMGDKIQSKNIAMEAEVNCIPGVQDVIRDETHALEVANFVGYPVMVKASAGGGGKGMRVAYNDEECADGLRLSKQEAKSSFGDDRIFIEKFIEDPRHIEIQVLADSHGNTVYLNERECSIQRRNQKVLEEAPSVFLTPETRKAMGEQACALARAVDYQSAGTVEFIIDPNEKFYFLEMNTRLQVEHPVTELTTGVDLVEQMIRVASGHALKFGQDDIGINGWSIEARVYAENPFQEFLPSTGLLNYYREPEGEGVRCDSGIEEGSQIQVYYDPLICKLVTYGNDRAEAMTIMRKALDSYTIRGVTHNVPFLRALVDHPKFISGDMSTNFIAQEYPQGFSAPELLGEDLPNYIGALLSVYLSRVATQHSISGQNESHDSEDQVWQKYANLVVTLEDGRIFAIYVDDFQHELLGNVELGNLDEDEGETVLDISIIQTDPEIEPTPEYLSTLTSDTQCTVRSTFATNDIVFESRVDEDDAMTFQLAQLGDTYQSLSLIYKGCEYSATVHTEQEYKLQSHFLEVEKEDLSKIIASPMPGQVISVNVQVGDIIAAGQEVLVVEAMKMQNALRATGSGVVAEISVKQGDTVASGDILVRLE